MRRAWVALGRGPLGANSPRRRGGVWAAAAHPPWGKRPQRPPLLPRPGRRGCRRARSIGARSEGIRPGEASARPGLHRKPRPGCHKSSSENRPLLLSEGYWIAWLRSPFFLSSTDELKTFCAFSEFRCSLFPSASRPDEPLASKPQRRWGHLLGGCTRSPGIPARVLWGGGAFALARGKEKEAGACDPRGHALRRF